MLPYDVWPMLSRDFRSYTDSFAINKVELLSIWLYKGNKLRDLKNVFTYPPHPSELQTFMISLF
jgi:hypothetical protein